MRVEAGDTIALSGEVSTGQMGWIQDGPFFAYLSGEEYGQTINESNGGRQTDVLLGQLDIAVSGAGAQVLVHFTLPTDIPPGEYWVMACNNPCRSGLGDLIGSQLFVGVDPPPTAAETVKSATAAPAVSVAEYAGSPDRAPTSLALARQPARATGLDGTWVAISAAFSLAVLLVASLVRTKGG